MSDPSHHDQLHLPGILFWELNDVNGIDFVETADKNFLRETGKRQKGVDYRMTTTNPNKVYTMKGMSKLRNIYHNPDDYE